MFKPFQWAAVALPALCLLLATACSTPASHPNQLSAFDGSTFDSMLLVHGALTSLETTVSTSYPKYIPMFNEAVVAYGAAYATYSDFRSVPTTQAEVSLTLGNLTIAIVALENAFQSDMHVSATVVAEIRARAKRLRTSAGQAGISVSDVLTELEIAAAIASTVPQTGPYAQLAQIVIQTTSAALTAEAAEVGQPIDLTLIQPISAIQ